MCDYKLKVPTMFILFFFNLIIILAFSQVYLLLLMIHNIKHTHTQTVLVRKIGNLVKKLKDKNLSFN